MDFHSYYYDVLGKDPKTDAFVLPAETEMTPELLAELLDEYRQHYAERLEVLESPFRRKFGIFARPRREDYKPDNHLSVNFCRQIATTFEGYFIGEPVDYRHANEAAARWLDDYVARNGQAGIDAQISMGCSKFGRAFELLYMNESGDAASAYISPRAGFVIYDDTVVSEPLFGVTFSYDEDGNTVGAWSDRNAKVQFRTGSGGIEFDKPEPHPFGGVPMVEYVQDDDAIGLYEDVFNLVDAFNAAISEKANDVEYFADAYLAVTGMELPDDFKKDLRKYRIINLFGDTGATNAFFLAKPNADVTQENLLTRLEVLIHKTSMVPDITDESFYTASGTALTKRLMPMANMAKTKERKFKDAAKRRFRLLANVPGPFDDWQGVEIVMRRNMPPDIATEAGVAGALMGITSEETALSVLSVVDSPQAEMARKEAEREAAAAAMMYQQLGTGADDEGNV